MKTTTAHQPPASPEDDGTLTDLVYRNRRLIRERPTAPGTPNPRIIEPTLPPTRRQRRSARPWLYLLAGMLTILLLWIGLQQWAIPTWNGIQDHWNYGNRPVTVMDADVGHGGVSHFIAEYYHQSIVVVEIPDASFTKYQVYVLSGYFGASHPVVVLTLSPGQQPGKPNLVVSIEGTGYGRTLYNTGNSFGVTGGQS